MTQSQLAHTLFPLGTQRKTETRRLAMENHLINAAKPDSQDICFVPNGDYAAVIEQYSGCKAQPGMFVDRNGAILGQHRGIIHYTVGQRKGLGISSPHPLYVCRICPEDNRVVLGSESDLLCRAAEVTGVNWISGRPPASAIRCRVKIRYRQKEQPATVTPAEGNRVPEKISFPARQL